MLSENLRKIRKKRKYTIKELSKATGLSISIIQKIETRENTNPKINTIYALADTLKVAPSKLIKR